MSPSPTPPRRKHLLDPDAPRKQATPEDLESLHRVQRRVASALILTTVVHLTAGFILLARFDVAGDRDDAKVALVLVGGAFWVVGVAATLAINKRPMLSPWLLTGLVPAALGLWWVLAG